MSVPVSVSVSVGRWLNLNWASDTGMGRGSGEGAGASQDPLQSEDVCMSVRFRKRMHSLPLFFFSCVTVSFFPSHVSPSEVSDCGGL